MQLATIRTAHGTVAVRLEGDTAVELAATDVGELLACADWERAAGATGEVTHAVDTLDFAPVVPRPEKIICVGRNYRSHIEEMGSEVPTHPTLFAKYWRALVGAHDPITLPYGSQKVDWEAELGLIIGKQVRHATVEEAAAAIAGYTVLNDVSARDFQNFTKQWLQGKTFEAATPVGPWLVTDTTPGRITCEVEGQLMQEGHCDDLVFDPVFLVKYISDIITLVPGDLISTGTTGGVGHARQPPVYLREGQTVVTSIEGVGELRNVCRGEDLK